MAKATDTDQVPPDWSISHVAPTNGAFNTSTAGGSGVIQKFTVLKPMLSAPRSGRGAAAQS